jgi:GT2 family glycosyltransferase
VTYNSAKWLDDFFRSLEWQSYPLERINLFVVDNGSSDGSLARCKELTVKLGLASRTFMQSNNVGFGLGHDRAIRAGTAPIVLVSNVDLQFERDAIKNAVHLFSASAESVASIEFAQTPYEHPKYYNPVTLRTNWNSHACVLMRREAYLTIGGYDEGIFMYGEDVELSYRFRSYGYELLYCPYARVRHDTYQEAGEIKPLQIVGSVAANVRLRLRFGSVGDRVRILPLIAALLIQEEPFPGARARMFRSVASAVRPTRKRVGSAPAQFPFHGFDYDVTRPGAFVPTLSLTGGPKVSVITRTYAGRQSLLLEALHSLMNQTYRNIEVIVVEDGSDGSRQIVEDFARSTEMNIIHVQAEKRGRSHAGNIGLETASGQLMCFLDDDDLLFADHIELLVAKLQEVEISSAVYSAAFEVGTDHLSKGGYDERTISAPAILMQEFSEATLWHHNYMAIQSVMFRRELFDVRGGFDVTLDALEDWNLWLRYAHNNQFSFVPKITSLYRIPASPEVLVRRQADLHTAYELARSRAALQLGLTNPPPGAVH